MWSTTKIFKGESSISPTFKQPSFPSLQTLRLSLYTYWCTQLFSIPYIYSNHPYYSPTTFSFLSSLIPTTMFYPPLLNINIEQNTDSLQSLQYIIHSNQLCIQGPSYHLPWDHYTLHIHFILMHMLTSPHLDQSLCTQHVSMGSVPYVGRPHTNCPKFSQPNKAEPINYHSYNSYLLVILLYENTIMYIATQCNTIIQPYYNIRLQYSMIKKLHTMNHST